MAEKQKLTDEMIEQFWYSWAMQGPPQSKVRRLAFFQAWPAELRCKFCYAPFDGPSGFVVKNVLRVYPSRYNPLYCNT